MQDERASAATGASVTMLGSDPFGTEAEVLGAPFPAFVLSHAAPTSETQSAIGMAQNAKRRGKSIDASTRNRCASPGCAEDSPPRFAPCASWASLRPDAVVARVRGVSGRLQPSAIAIATATDTD